MKVVVWIAEGVWQAAVDGARTVLASDAEVVLLHVIPDDVQEVVHGAFAGLLGRHRSAPRVIDDTATGASQDLLAAAAKRLDRPSTPDTRRGRVEREVIAACADADLLVLSRDGDRSRLGPHSFGPAGRFVVDHAPCTVLVVWPGSVPGLGSIPPPPHDPPPHHPAPHDRPPHGPPPQEPGHHAAPPHLRQGRPPSS